MILRQFSPALKEIGSERLERGGVWEALKNSENITLESKALEPVQCFNKETFKWQKSLNYSKVVKGQ